MRGQAELLARATGLTPSAGQPTDQLVKVRGIKTTKKLKAGSCFRVLHTPLPFNRAALIAAAAGKIIARIPNVGGLFSPEQLPHSAAWPALKFMQDQVRAFPHTAFYSTKAAIASCLQRMGELNMIYTCVQRPDGRRFITFPPPRFIK